MTKPVRYQKGQLYRDHGVVCSLPRARPPGRWLGQTEAEDEALGKPEETSQAVQHRAAARSVHAEDQRGSCYPGSSMTLSEFVETVYLPWAEAERRASTYKGYKEIWENHLLKRIGHVRLREFRTVHASRMLRAIAGECDLTKTTLQHIKAVLSGVFTYAKNEGAFDGSNPVQGAMIPGNAREPEETFAYNLFQILRILEILPLLPKGVVATAALAGLREGELRGLEWPDYTGDQLAVNRSTWKGVVNQPKLARVASRFL